MSIFTPKSLTGFYNFLRKVAADAEKKTAVGKIQITVAISLILNAGGALGLFEMYKSGIQYDKILHFIIPFLFTVNSTSFFSIYYDKPFKKALLISIILVVIGNFSWKLYEFLSDTIFKTQSLTNDSSNEILDIAWDLILGFLGIFIACLYLVYDEKAKRKNPQ